MTVNEAYLVVHGATVTLNYIPVMTPGLYDKFPAPTETLPGQKKSRKWTDMPKEHVSSTWAIQICLICNHYRIKIQPEQRVISKNHKRQVDRTNRLGRRTFGAFFPVLPILIYMADMELAHYITSTF